MMHCFEGSRSVMPVVLLLGARRRASATYSQHSTDMIELRISPVALPRPAKHEDPMPELALIPAPASSGDDRQLPRNVEAEAAFLGAILIDNRVVEDLPVQLTPAHFFEPLHGRIFAQAMALIERNSIATPVTLKPFFEHDEA